MSSGGTIGLAVLISGGGRTLVNLHEKIRQRTLAATIERVISSRGDAAGVARAKELGLETVVVEHGLLAPEAFQRGLTEAVAGVDLVCLAGFLRLWRIPNEWYGRVINIHPALLPAFGGRGMYGLRVHRAVLASGRTISGCTVHFCDNEYDHGPTILQRTVPVFPDDTAESLADRVFQQECLAYPEAIGLFAENRVRLTGTEVVILPRRAGRDEAQAGPA